MGETKDLSPEVLQRIARNAARTYVAGFSGLSVENLKGYTDDEIDRIVTFIETDGNSSESTSAAGGEVIGKTTQPFAELITQSSTDLLLGMGRAQKARSNTQNKVQAARKNVRRLIEANAFKDIDTPLKTVAADPKINAKSHAPKQKPVRPCQPDLRAYGIAFVLTFLISLPLSRFQIPSALLGSSVIFVFFAVGRLALHGQYGWFRDYSAIAMKLIWAMLAVFGGYMLFENYGVLAFLITPFTAMPVVYGLSLAWGLGEDK